MRRFFLGMAITGIATLAPAWALAGDQEAAQDIASHLRDSGKMKGYSIGVKVSESTAWLGGTVRSEEQMSDALEIARQTPGITKVVNELSVDTATAQPETSMAEKIGSAGKSLSRKIASARPTIQSPVRQASGAGDDNRAQLASRDVDVEAPTAQTAPSSMPRAARSPRPFAPAMHPAAQQQMRMASAPGGMEMAAGGGYGGPMPMHAPGNVGPVAPARFDHPQMPGYAWPSYAAYPNYAALTYPKQYSPTAWPFIGPFYPYPQVPLGWRKVTLEWDDGWWMLDFKD